MIGRSDNTATNHFIDLLGTEAVNRRMETLGFPRIKLLGRIPDRDPEETQNARWKGLVLGSMTPDDTAELYRRLATASLLGGPADALAIDVLGSQHQTDRIPRLLLVDGARWAGKSGTLRGRRNDSGVLTNKKGRFVLVMFADGISDAYGAAYNVNQTMGEIAKSIVNEWSR
jgi:beta-lactamase class A